MRNGLVLIPNDRTYVYVPVVCSGCERCSPDHAASAEVGVEARPRPLRKLFVRMAANRAGASDEVVEKALAHLEAESDRPFLDWLQNGGLEKLLQLILMLLPMFL